MKIFALFLFCLWSQFVTAAEDERLPNKCEGRTRKKKKKEPFWSATAVFVVNSKCLHSVSVQVSDRGAPGGSAENRSVQRSPGGRRSFGHRQKKKKDQIQHLVSKKKKKSKCAPWRVFSQSVFYCKQMAGGSGLLHSELIFNLVCLNSGKPGWLRCWTTSVSASCSTMFTLRDQAASGTPR